MLLNIYKSDRFVRVFHVFLFCMVSVVYQKRLRRERKARKRVQDQLEQELKRRAQLEEMIKAAGAPADALRVLTGTSNVARMTL